MKIIRTFNGLSEAEADLQIIRGCLLINFVYGNACGIEIKEQESTREMFLSLLDELSLREKNIRGNITRKDPGIRRIPTAMLKSTGKPAMPVEILRDENTPYEGEFARKTVIDPITGKEKIIKVTFKQWFKEQRELGNL